MLLFVETAVYIFGVLNVEIYALCGLIIKIVKVIWDNQRRR